MIFCPYSSLLNFCLVVTMFKSFSVIGTPLNSLTSSKKSYLCYNHPKPTSSDRKLKPIDCEFETNQNKEQKKSIFSGSTLKNGVTTNTSSNNQNKNMVKIDLNCQANSDICSKVKNAFETAAGYLQNVIIFNKEIVVNASFYSFCEIIRECATNNLITLGQAGAARSIALNDMEDGKRRLYPQALVKQLDLPKQPKFSKVDIIAEFNSDANFWFEGMGNLKEDQSDFLLVISHELIHGLGFSSTYSDYFNDVPTSLTPYPEVYIDESSNEIEFAGFTENIFDKYIIESSNQKSLTSEYADNMGKFVKDKKTYTSQQSLESEFSNSQAYELGQKLLKLATTKGALSFKTNNDSVVLETSLNPFTSLSSISHVDYKMYTNTKDFLMRYKTDTGDRLSTLVGKLGQWDTAPYGPGVIGILEKMGYATNGNPNPQIKVTISDSTIILNIRNIIAISLSTLLITTSMNVCF